MVMDLERQSDGRLHFSLGKIERWVVVICAAALIGAFGWIFNRIISQLDANNMATQELARQQAVMNLQMTTLTTQLADVPTMSRRLAEHEVRINRLETDVQELRRMRNLE